MLFGIVEINITNTSGFLSGEVSQYVETKDLLELTRVNKIMKNYAMLVIYTTA